MTNPPPPVQRLRLTYSKTGDARYIGHLDLARFWERVFRRVDLPLAYSHGFNPQPRIQFASALPVGVAGEQELLDLWLTRRVRPDAWIEPIARNLPPGFAILSLEEVDLGLPAMQASLRRAIYRVCFQDIDQDALAQSVAALLARETIPRPHFKKPHKTYDLRPRILAIDLLPDAPGCVRMTLQAGSLGNARVSEVIDAMGLAGIPHDITRERLILEEPTLTKAGDFD
jgi:radical SAM-linked protein